MLTVNASSEVHILRLEYFITSIREKHSRSHLLLRHLILIGNPPGFEVEIELHLSTILRIIHRFHFAQLLSRNWVHR